MTTYPTVKLECGARALDINDRARFYVRTYFVPPATVEAAQISMGTALNARGGRLNGRKPQVRDWTFSVRIVGSSEADIQAAARSLKAMLALAGDETEPLYLAYKANSDTPEPLWGQFGALLRYEVLNATVEFGDDYARGTRRARALVATITLTIQPYALGKQQRLCTATGGIVEDTIGSADGLSRGVIVPGTTTNLFTNPVFGHATWNNGWSSGAGMTAAQNTDDDFLMIPGATNSAKLLAAGGTRVFYQALTATVATYTLSSYVKKEDSSAVTAADCRLYFDNNLVTTTYTGIGNGIYRLSYTGTASAGLTNYGIGVADGRVVYCNGFQVENTGFTTPLCFGDALGCSWTGTAHASTSTRTPAFLKLALASDDWSNAEWTMRIIWRAGCASTQLGTSYFFDLGSTFHLRFDTTNDELILRDGTNQATSAAGQAFALNEVVVFYATAKPGTGLVLYRNGTSLATANTYTPIAPPASIYFGTDTSGANPIYGTFMGIDIFPRALSTTEVANDYANIAPLAADGRRVSAIPWLWTKDGDNVVDNCDDSTRDNWCVVGGIAGSVEALTEIKAALDSTPGGYFFVLSKCGYNHFMVPIDAKVYADQGGVADANSSGGAYSTNYDLSAADANISSPAFSTYREWKGSVHFFARLFKSAGAGTTVNLVPVISHGYASMFGNEKTVSVDGTMRMYYLGHIPIGEVQINLYDYVRQRIYPKILGKQATVTLNVDFSMFIPNASVIYVPTAITASNSLLIVDGVVTEIASDYLYGYRSAFGDKIELSPSEFNFLFVISAAMGGAHTITHTATLSVRITPRWALV